MLERFGRRRQGGRHDRVAFAQAIENLRISAIIRADFSLWFIVVGGGSI